MSEILFREKDHTYWCGDKELLAVSRFLELFKPKFDEDGSILINKAKKEGVTPKELQAQWDKIRDDSCKKGSLIHKNLEIYIETGEIVENEYSDITKKFAEIKFKGKLFCETLLFSTDIMVAGQADLIEIFNDDSLYLWDFKSGAKELSTYSFYGNRFLYPISHLYESQLQGYYLQLNLYNYLLEKMGYKTKKMTILHLQTKKNIIKHLPVPYMRTEILRMIEHYKTGAVVDDFEF